MTETILFSTLKWGDSYTYRENGPVQVVHSFYPDGIVVKREDGWLVKVTPEHEGYHKHVLKIRK